MSEARRSFLHRINAFKSAAYDDALVSREPSEEEHNRRSRILRSGLSVVGFSILEDFIDSRSSEVLARIGNSSVKFQRLPDPLREATTIGVINALNFEIRLRRKNDDDISSFVQRHARLVASTAESGYQLSSLALGRSGSNLNHEDIKQILRSFNIHDPWGNIDDIASRVNIGVPSLREAYKSATNRRHQGAHQADADIAPTDLQFYFKHALAIALSFDSLISTSLKLILDADRKYLEGEKNPDEKDIYIRFVDDSGGSWREISEKSERAYRVDNDRDIILEGATKRARNNDEIVVVRDITQTPILWKSPFVA